MSNPAKQDLKKMKAWQGKIKPKTNNIWMPKIEYTEFEISDMTGHHRVVAMQNILSSKGSMNLRDKSGSVYHVDMQTANAFLLVYNHLKSEKAKENMREISLPVIMRKVWGVVTS